jgi:putative chitobiose transport system substrate-binding protein
LAGKGAWLSLNSHLSDENIQQYLPKIWQANSLNGSTFGFPWYLTTEIILYNQEILKQAGLKAPPSTYEELAKAAATIKEKTGKYAFFVTFLANDSAEVLESLVQMGVELFDHNGKSAFNSPAGVAAFNYWVDLYQKGLLPPEVLTQGHREAVELYQSGQLAMLSTGAEFFKSIITNAPNIAKVTGSAPQITGENGKRSVAVMNLVIPKDSNQIQAAVDFALFVTNTVNQIKFAQAADVLPSTVQGVQEYLQKISLEKGDSPIARARQVSARQLATAEVLIPPKRELNQLQKIIYENLQAAMLGEKTVPTALQEAAEQWDLLVGD